MLPDQSTPLAVIGKIEGRSPAQMAWERIKHDKTAWVSAAVVGFFILLGIVAPLLQRIVHTTPDAFHPEALDANGGALPIGPFGGTPTCQ